jgi:hypothetical protein
LHALLCRICCSLSIFADILFSIFCKNRNERIFRWIQPVLARVNISTRSAPARRSVPAHSLTVLPVVNTSSTKRIFLFLTLWGCLTENDPEILRRLSVPLSCVWGTVGRILIRTAGSMILLLPGKQQRARRRDWLKPLCRRRCAWSGTGRMRSGSLNSRKPGEATASLAREARGRSSAL